MKTYEEMAQNALGRIDRYKTEQKKRRKAAVRIAAPVACFCLVAVLGFSAWQAGYFQKTPAVSGGPDVDASGVPIPNPNGLIEREEMPEVFPEHPILRPGDDGYVAPIPTPNPDAQDAANEPAHTENAPDAPVGSDTQEPPAPEIITGNDGEQKGSTGVTDGSALFWWKNKLVMSGDLYWAIDGNPGAVFSVLAAYRPATANITDFTYEGKTLAEWAIAADNERILPDKMAELLKLGDELKYGTALYETGTPDGIKWYQSLYEEKVAYFGDLIDKYIVDGNFLRDALEKDIAALTSITVTTPDGTTTVTSNGETSARKQYALAYDAYLETVLPAAVSRLSSSGISCARDAYRNNVLTLLVTAAQLENLPLDDLENWSFSLASGDLKGTSDDETYAAGFKIVN